MFVSRFILFPPPPKHMYRAGHYRRWRLSPHWSPPLGGERRPRVPAPYPHVSQTPPPSSPRKPRVGDEQGLLIGGHTHHQSATPQSTLHPTVPRFLPTDGQGKRTLTTQQRPHNSRAGSDKTEVFGGGQNHQQQSPAERNPRATKANRAGTPSNLQDQGTGHRLRPAPTPRRTQPAATGT